jgi:hypothetical protein
MPIRPPITSAEILSWADAQFLRTARWPDLEDGLVVGGPGLTWKAVDMALKAGRRGLPGGSSLARLLAADRGVHHKHESPWLTEESITAWAAAHRAVTGAWPTERRPWLRRRWSGGYGPAKPAPTTPACVAACEGASPT